ncbi:MAG: diaminopimelate epimerase [Coriobacteriia bacterium]|nr:diaminopimelate epimerase [Coriobacteriia bacterium]
MDLRFTKMHGCGNDFVVVDDRTSEWDFDETAVSLLCDRHFGIGADGLILVRPATAPGAEFLMHYINADGSLAEMCGNGVRVFAKFLADRGLVTGDRVVVQTLGGLKPIELARGDDGRVRTARVDMGEPILEAALIPTTLPGEPVIDALISTDLGEFAVTCVSMGNPHAIIWVDDVDEAPVTTLGPIIETHPAFPRKTNVEFAQVIDGEDRIRLRVWERGVGETLACGTGACATLVAAVLSCRTGRSATIELPGGDLVIGWSPEGDVYMSGPADEVFEGVWTIPDDE